MEFHERLKWLRKNKNCTQLQVANALQITHRQYQRLEANDAKPHYENLISLADFFSVPIDFLAGRGVFASWDIIAEHKSEVIQVIEEISPFFKSLNLNENFSLFVSLLPVIFQKIEIDTTKNKLALYVINPFSESQNTIDSIH